jgi:hypothetical protein
MYELHKKYLFLIKLFRTIYLKAAILFLVYNKFIYISH